MFPKQTFICSNKGQRVRYLDPPPSFGNAEGRGGNRVPQAARMASFLPASRDGLAPVCVKRMGQVTRYSTHDAVPLSCPSDQLRKPKRKGARLVLRLMPGLTLVASGSEQGPCRAHLNTVARVKQFYQVLLWSRRYESQSSRLASGLSSPSNCRTV